jgi:hypothetical protein
MKRTEQEAEESGRASAVFGADLANCHFTLFATKELTRAWERGRSRGEVEKRRRNLAEMG